MTNEENESSKGRTFADGLSVRVSEETTDKLAEGVLTVFSPLIEGMGIVGDHLRVHREKVAIKAGKRVQELVLQEETIGPVPPKLFAPWLEGVSLEDIEDDVMIDAWASVLSRASTDYNPQMLSFLSILGQLTSVHASLLRDIAIFNDVKGGSTLSDMTSGYVQVLLGIDAYTNEVLVRYEDSSDIDEAFSARDDIFEKRGTLVFHASVIDKVRGDVKCNRFGYTSECEDGDLSLQLAVLESLGLIYRYMEYFDARVLNSTLLLHMVVLTEFGEAFCENCIPEVIDAVRLESKAK